MEQEKERKTLSGSMKLLFDRAGIPLGRPSRTIGWIGDLFLSQSRLPECDPTLFTGFLLPAFGHVQLDKVQEFLRNFVSGIRIPEIEGGCWYGQENPVLTSLWVLSKQ